MDCTECNGSGACDPCDGYGFYPDSYPGAGDGPECECCGGSGNCSECHSQRTASTTTGNDGDNEHQRVSA